MLEPETKNVEARLKKGNVYLVADNIELTICSDETTVPPVIEVN